MSFESPSAACRPAPFWSWNDTLTDEELRWQVRQLQAAGYGGFFMHSRVGLETEYLSDEWFDRIGACIDEARRSGMQAWLYDEDKWPSGFAGGWMTRRHPETRGIGLLGQYIEADEIDAALKDDNSVALFAIRSDGGQGQYASRRLGAGGRPEPGEQVLWLRTAPFDKLNWFNGEAYLDILNPEAVATFLEMTVEGYTRRFRGDYGQAVPGIFTDEPNFAPYVGGLCHEIQVTVVPWTRRLPGLFRERFGYDLVDHLAALACRVPGFEKVRHDYHRLVTERFVEAFSRPYGELCERLGLKLTGHWLAEDGLDEQVRHIGAAMPHYEFEQVPGIDHLRRNIEDALTLKQCASVAHQFGRQQVMCEIFGVSGQDFTFEDAKWIGDFHLALGVNYFCPHLTLYSFTGDRKRDYPPTFSYHQPYWDRMSVINDYFARGGYLARSGFHQTRILLLHPIASAWSFFSRFEDSPEVRRYHDELVMLQDGMLRQHLDFDYGDEMILARHGSVEDRAFHVASHGRYDVVVVPPSFTWATETVELLEAFVEAGGNLLFVGETPEAIGGEAQAERWQRLVERSGSRRVDNEEGAVRDVLEAMSVRDVTIRDQAGAEIGAVLYHHRRDGDRGVWFFCNTDREKSYEARITIEGEGGLMRCDLASGQIEPLPVESTCAGRIDFVHEFAPTGSLAVVVDPDQSNQAPAAACREVNRKSLDRDWEFSRTHPNTLVLDTCRWSLNDEPLGESTPVWKVRHAAFDAAGLEEYRGLQPWVLTERGIRPTRSVKVTMAFTFESERDAPNASLVVERAEEFEITLNGERVSTATDEWHWDKRFRRLDVAGGIRKGTNELVLSTNYRLGVEIEDVFIVGDFAVRRLSETAYAITNEPAGLTVGDWVKQGYPFYSGNMVYRQRFEHQVEPGRHVRLRLVDPAGTLFEIRVNGSLAGTLAWRPWEMDITDLLKAGENMLEIVVYGSLRNSFGPLHNLQYAEGNNNWWIGPEAFVDEARWTDAYMLAPYGLIGGAELVELV